MIGFGGCLRLLVEPLQRLSPRGSPSTGGRRRQRCTASGGQYARVGCTRERIIRMHMDAWRRLSMYVKPDVHLPFVGVTSVCDVAYVLSTLTVCPSLLLLQVHLGLRHRHIRRNAVRIAPGVAWPAFHRASASLHGLPGALTSATPLTCKHCSTHLHYPLPTCQVVVQYAPWLSKALASGAVGGAEASGLPPNLLRMAANALKSMESAGAVSPLCGMGGVDRSSPSRLGRINECKTYFYQVWTYVFIPYSETRPPEPCPHLRSTAPRTWVPVRRPWCRCTPKCRPTSTQWMPYIQPWMQHGHRGCIAGKVVSQ